MAYQEAEYDYEEEGGVIDPVWLLTLCVALGIWLVINRYHSILNRAIFFRLTPPPVRPRFPRLLGMDSDHTGRVHSKSKKLGQRRSCLSLRWRRILALTAFFLRSPSPTENTSLLTTLLRPTTWTPFWLIALKI